MTIRNGGQALVDALVVHGVDTVFGIPGTHNLAAFAALATSPIRTVLTRHEQGAGYAADGYARVAGRPGVCLTTTGPAILNALAAAAQAWSDSVPVLFISPGMPTGHPISTVLMSKPIMPESGLPRSLRKSRTGSRPDAVA